MFTTTKATREKALVVAAATRRAMERHICSKSQFKFKCFSCGEFINRGDKITKCNRATTGMTLRYRGADSMNGLTMAETCFYQGESGKDMWVHIGCNPCHWNSRRFIGINTEWGTKVKMEFDEDYETTGRSHWHNFLERNGYPEEKFMRYRIIDSVIKFQALWRGYIYKKAYPVALQQQREQREQRARARFAQYQEMIRTSPQVGEHIEVLFNKNKPTETVYSGEVIEVQYRGCQGIKIKVKFHFDGEVRKYTGKKFNILKKECEWHKRKLGIEAKLTGRLNTARMGRLVCVPNQPTFNNTPVDWRYHFPDSTPV